jgi:mRNA-degrading endonuclease RelE of RelBE toxin-antitoxin system
MYKVKLSDTARKAYERLELKRAEQLDRCFKVLEENPFDFRNHDIKKLHGPLRGLLRLRKGKLRIVYRVNTDQKTVEVIAIKTREHAYRGRRL